MKRLFSIFLFSLSFSLWLEAAVDSKWTEHRRALLVNASTDRAHAEKIKELEKSLQAKGFVVKVIGDAPKTDGVTYEKWVRSIPTMGVSVFYYCGRLETETHLKFMRLQTQQCLIGLLFSSQSGDECFGVALRSI